MTDSSLNLLLHFSTKSNKASGKKPTKYMENLILVHTENIPLVTHHDEDHEEDNDNDYDDYNEPNARRADETTRPSFMDKLATSTEWLRQKVTRDKLVALYRHLSITLDLGLINLDLFNCTKILKMVLQF